MDYPSWAPAVLVECHREIGHSGSNRPRRGINKPGLDPDVADGTNPPKKTTEEEFELHSYRQLVRTFLSPDKESVELLGRLLTDPRMKDAWGALGKRVNNDKDFFDFLWACTGGLAGWRNDLKQTASERKAFSQETQELIAELNNRIKKSGFLDHYLFLRLIDDYTIGDLLKELGSSQDVGLARFSIGARLPKFSDILMDLAKEVKRYGEEEPSVKRPNSENADIRYFVRSLSEYLQKKYGQPLHEVVSATTEVVFDRRNISSDYVRELRRRYP